MSNRSVYSCENHKVSIFLFKIMNSWESGGTFGLLPTNGFAALVVADIRYLEVKRRKVRTISSVTRCNKEVGSLKDTGNVILVMSFPIMDLRMP